MECGTAFQNDRASTALCRNQVVLFSENVRVAIRNRNSPDNPASDAFGSGESDMRVSFFPVPDGISSSFVRRVVSTQIWPKDAVKIL